MSDGRLFHLPDLPNAGYATFREKALSDAVMQFLRTLERDRLRLLTVVLEGPATWRRIAQSIWRGLRIGEDHQLLDEIYKYLELQACPPVIQRQLLDAAQNPAKWRELVDSARPELEKQREGLKLLAKWS